MLNEIYIYIYIYKPGKLGGGWLRLEMLKPSKRAFVFNTLLKKTFL
jgi:hypothetical protein